MIHEFDRRFWIGGSDIDKYVLAPNKETKTWHKWWAEKCGFGEKTFSGNSAARTGTKLEHSILKTFDENIVWDEQIRYPKLMLRINYDGRLGGHLYEVKCHRHTNDLDLSKFRGQVITQAWVYEQMADELGLPPFEGISILEYPFYPDEEFSVYDEETIENGLILIDKERIKVHEVSYKSSQFRGVKTNLKPLAKKLRRLVEDEEV